MIEIIVAALLQIATISGSTTTASTTSQEPSEQPTVVLTEKAGGTGTWDNND